MNGVARGVLIGVVIGALIGLLAGLVLQALFGGDLEEYELIGGLLGLVFGGILGGFYGGVAKLPKGQAWNAAVGPGDALRLPDEDEPRGAW